MAGRISAGILLHRTRERLEVFLVHPGGPFWAKKDLGSWSIPKGDVEEGEDPRVAAVREFTEETGFAIEGELRPMTAVRQKGGKTVIAFAVEGDCDPAALRSNVFQLEWPPRSGRRVEFPEADRAAWFGIEQARRRILAGQAPLLDEIERITS